MGIFEIITTLNLILSITALLVAKNGITIIVRTSEQTETKKISSDSKTTEVDRLLPTSDAGKQSISVDGSDVGRIESIGKLLSNAPKPKSGFGSKTKI